MAGIIPTDSVAERASGQPRRLVLRDLPTRLSLSGCAGGNFHTVYMNLGECCWSNADLSAEPASALGNIAAAEWAGHHTVADWFIAVRAANLENAEASAMWVDQTGVDHTDGEREENGDEHKFHGPTVRFQKRDLLGRTVCIARLALDG